MINIIVNNSILDLPQNFILPTTLVSDLFNNIEDDPSYSFDVSLPNTLHNVQTLGLFNLLNSKKVLFTECTIQLNNVTVAAILNILNPTEKGDIDIQIIYNNGIAEFLNTPLNQFNFNGIHLGDNDTEVEAEYTNAAKCLRNDFTLPQMYTTAQMPEDNVGWFTTNFTGIINAWDHNSADLVKNTYHTPSGWLDLKTPIVPQFKIKYILQQLFTLLGFNASGTFFTADAFNASCIYNTVMTTLTFGNKRQMLRAQSSNPFTLPVSTEVQIPINNDSAAPNDDPDNIFDTDEYTITITEDTDYSFYFTVDYDSEQIEYFEILMYKVTGGTIATTPHSTIGIHGAGNGGNSNSSATGKAIYKTKDSTFNLVAVGDVYTFKIKLNDDYGPGASATQSTINKVTFVVNDVGVQAKPQTIYPQHYLPSITLRELLENLFIYGLHFKFNLIGNTVAINYNTLQRTNRPNYSLPLKYVELIEEPLAFSLTTTNTTHSHFVEDGMALGSNIILDDVSLTVNTFQNLPSPGHVGQLCHVLAENAVYKVALNGSSIKTWYRYAIVSQTVTTGNINSTNTKVLTYKCPAQLAIYNHLLFSNPNVYYFSPQVNFDFGFIKATGVTGQMDELIFVNAFFTGGESNLPYNFGTSLNRKWNGNILPNAAAPEVEFTPAFIYNTFLSNWWPLLANSQVAKCIIPMQTKGMLSTNYQQTIVINQAEGLVQKLEFELLDTPTTVATATVRII